MGNPVENPGLPEHVHRRADEDPKAEKRAERQVASLFALSALSTILFIYSYFFIKKDVFAFIPLLGNMNIQQLLLGFIGFSSTDMTFKFSSNSTTPYAVGSPTNAPKQNIHRQHPN